MSSTRIFAGLLILAAIAGPPVISAWRWQRALAPRPVPLRILATAVIALTLLLLTAELLGTVGLFKTGWLIAASWVVAASAYALARRVTPPADQAAAFDPAAKRGLERWVTVAAAAAVAVVSIRWLAALASVQANGMHDPDSLHHHLSFSAEFVRSGWITRLHPVLPDAVNVFQPYDTELLQGVGMLALGRDVLTPLLSIGWLPLLFLAAWCAGIRDGVAPFTLLTVTWVAGIPALILTNSGTAVNDLATMACLAAAVALWRASDYDRGWLAVSGLAAGLALGMKLTALAPVCALVLAIVALAPRERRRATIGVLAAALMAGGAFWYLRSLGRTGTPLAGVDLPLFPSPDLPLVERFGFSVSDYLFSGDVWRTVFQPGLRHFFGWNSLLVLVAVAPALPYLARRRDRAVLALACCSLLGVVAYLLTPAGAWGFEGRPDLLLFFANLRYGLPALTLIALTAGLGLAGAGPRLRLWLVGWLSAAIAWEALRSGVFADLPARFTVRALALAAALTASAVAARFAPLPRRWGWVAATGALVLAAVVAGPTITRHYLAEASAGPNVAASRVFKWAAGLRGARIGHYAFDPNYPLYGPSWDNHVEYIGVATPHGGFRAVANCREYVDLLARHHLEYVVLGPSRRLEQNLDLPRWTSTQPGATEALAAPPYLVFRVEPPYDPSRCPGR